jgi:hypothetical protein
MTREVQNKPESVIAQPPQNLDTTAGTDRLPGTVVRDGSPKATEARFNAIYGSGEFTFAAIAANNGLQDIYSPTEQLFAPGSEKARSDASANCSDSLNYGNPEDLYGWENLLAKAPASYSETVEHTDQLEKSKETDASYTPEVSMHQILSVAETLGKDHFRWQDKPNGPGKCNLYVDAVMKDAGLPRPWAESGVQSCEKLDQALAKDPRYDRTWQTDYSSSSAYQMSYKNWAYFAPKAGDVFIWATNLAVHAAIADGNGKLYYAGARDPNKHGFGHTEIENFTGSTPRHETNYGPPTSVYHYKNLTP